MLWPKKNLYKESDKEKKFLRLGNSPQPPPPPKKTFLMVRPKYVGLYFFCHQESSCCHLIFFLRGDKRGGVGGWVGELGGEFKYNQRKVEIRTKTPFYQAALFQGSSLVPRL